ncbi:ranscription-associated recombination protein [Encephalitozoon intestinalis ATCC 50506]|uniref:Ranscription-associated recombination protein n=1 Tax=Encephalitozoon intestinalis (strain ATCC 50506) TaxID=876142 RepID=E0S5F2_ENCIT|nr:ranscription-associated recombination protein [Encephalitozoon intestinalis ATCC 50506]ADM10937.1 ranscription-associated recombination protein [Encephalitozoon intestinalis ATCC 50506]UTX44572.1 BUD SITE selection protein [Encephalitozoon intestinalis]
MEWVEAVNSKIEAEDGEYVSQLFGTSTDIDERLRSMDLYKVASPFSTLLGYQAEFLAEKSYGSSEQLIRNAVETIGREKWTGPIIKRIAHGLLELRNQRNSGRMSRLLLDMYRKLLEQENPSFAYVGNALFQMYLEMGKFRAAEDLLIAAREPPARSKGHYVFHYYRGIIKMHQEDFKESYLSLEKAFKYGRWRKIMAPIYFTSSLLVNKSPKSIYLEKFECSYLSKLAFVIREGMYMDVDDAARETLKEIKDYNLDRIISAHCPLVCFNNLVDKIYQRYGHDSRLDIQRIIEELPEIDFKEIICLLSSVIGFGRLRGYISIGRKVVVLSRVDPFPTLSK